MVNRRLSNHYGICVLLWLCGPGFGLSLSDVEHEEPHVSAPAVGYEAPPRIAIFHGGPLDDRIYLTDPNDMLFVAAPEQNRIPRSLSLSERPFVHVAMFWGMQYEVYASDRELLRRLNPESAGRSGRFYPAHGGHAAAFTYEHQSHEHHVVGEEALSALRKHGIPTAID